jgi:hypothetical protein
MADSDLSDGQRNLDQQPEGVAQPDNSKNARYVAGKDA